MSVKRVVIRISDLLQQGAEPRSLFKGTLDLEECLVRMTQNPISADNIRRCELAFGLGGYKGPDIGRERTVCEDRHWYVQSLFPFPDTDGPKEYGAGVALDFAPTLFVRLCSQNLMLLGFRGRAVFEVDYDRQAQGRSWIPLGILSARRMDPTLRRIFLEADRIGFRPTGAPPPSVGARSILANAAQGGEEFSLRLLTRSLGGAQENPPRAGETEDSIQGSRYLLAFAVRPKEVL
jgi:hypothetical protein